MIKKPEKISGSIKDKVLGILENENLFQKILEKAKNNLINRGVASLKVDILRYEMISILRTELGQNLDIYNEKTWNFKNKKELGEILLGKLYGKLLPFCSTKIKKPETSDQRKADFIGAETPKPKNNIPSSRPFKGRSTKGAGVFVEKSQPSGDV